MNLVQQARGVESLGGFSNDLNAHLQPGGIVLSTPEVFIMLRRVKIPASVERIVNPWERWPSEECNCWFIWLLCGSGAAALETLVPRHGRLEWAGFQTSGGPKFLRFNKLENHFTRHGFTR